MNRDLRPIFIAILKPESMVKERNGSAGTFEKVTLTSLSHSITLLSSSLSTGVNPTCQARHVGDAPLPSLPIMSSPLADVLQISILGNESIRVGFHLLPYIFNTVVTTLPSSTYVLVTDTNLSRLYLSDIKTAYEDAAAKAGSKARFLVYEVAPGEGAKSRKVKEEIEDWLLDNKCTRDTVILAFGGGVIGDLTGFVAATL
jgi:hypothetical protein